MLILKGAAHPSGGTAPLRLKKLHLAQTALDCLA